IIPTSAQTEQRGQGKGRAARQQRRCSWSQLRPRGTHGPEHGGTWAGLQPPAPGDPGRAAVPAQREPGWAVVPARRGPGRAAAPARRDPGWAVVPARRGPGWAAAPARRDPGWAVVPAQRDPGWAAAPARRDPSQAIVPAQREPGGTSGPKTSRGSKGREKRGEEIKSKQTRDSELLLNLFRAGHSVTRAGQKGRGWQCLQSDTRCGYKRQQLSQLNAELLAESTVVLRKSNGLKGTQLFSQSRD
uniref:Uncharacterized protein n=1 Tax=Nothoprocta perdicaria TaxID=30464 RepID=A0A8C6ZI78_NOTPE